MNKGRLLNRRQALLLSLAACSGIQVVKTEKVLSLGQQIQYLNSPKRTFAVSGKATLKERAAKKGLIYGASSRYTSLFSNPKFANCFAQECGLLVPEWALKWSCGNEVLRPHQNSFDFTAADSLAKFAHAHGLLFRGHALVWHECMPQWFKEVANRQNAQQFLSQHIRAVAGRYTGKMHSWDVVNEAIEPNDGRPDGLRKTLWLELLGSDYIDFAFRVAAEVDPKALLVYNDYGLEYDTHEDAVKRNAVLNLLEKLRSQGTPVHALGIQSHLSGKETRFNGQKFRAFLKDVASLDLKILLTEMDVADRRLPLDPVVRDRFVAGAYEDYLLAALDEKAVIAVITWGLSDRYTWLSEFQPRPDGAAVRPLPLDTNFKRKLAWNAIARAFDNAPQR